MKRTLIIILICVVAATCIVTQAKGQMLPQKPRKQSGAGPKVDDNTYTPAGIKIADTLIKNGDKIAIIWGIMGPPDFIWAMRGKDDPSQDYIKMAYYSYGLNFNVNNNENTIRGIMIEENNLQYKLINCPFKIGESHNDVLTAWGEPEKAMGGTLAYWRRGVYITIDEQGKITHIYITEPGHFEDEK